MGPAEISETWEVIKEKGQQFPGIKFTWLLLSIVSALVVLRIHDLDWLEKLKMCLEVAGLAIPVAVALWQLGSFWDGNVFNPLFSPKSDDLWYWLGHRMRNARFQAAQVIETGSVKSKRSAVQIEGIYKRAEALYKNTSEWKKYVRPRLELSKFFRSLIFLPLAVFFYNAFQKQLPELKAPENFLREYAFLARPAATWICAGLALVFLTLYIFLRLGHMRALYRLLVTSPPVFQEMECFGGLQVDSPQEISCSGYLLFVSKLRLRRIYRLDCATARSFEFFFRPLNWMPDDQKARELVLAARESDSQKAASA